MESVYHIHLLQVIEVVAENDEEATKLAEWYKDQHKFWLSPERLQLNMVQKVERKRSCSNKKGKV